MYFATRVRIWRAARLCRAMYTVLLLTEIAKQSVLALRSMAKEVLQRNTHGDILSVLCSPCHLHNGCSVHLATFTMDAVFTLPPSQWMQCSPCHLHYGCSVHLATFTMDAVFTLPPSKWMQCSPCHLHYGCSVHLRSDGETSLLEVSNTTKIATKRTQARPIRTRVCKYTDRLCGLVFRAPGC
jgi:hypothetical protein